MLLTEAVPRCFDTNIACWTDHGVDRWRIFPTVCFSTFDPSVFAFSGKSRIGSEFGSEVVGMQTEVETEFFRPYLRNSVFGRNISVFVPHFTRIPDRPK
jgi:hypothetical protein